MKSAILEKNIIFKIILCVFIFSTHTLSFSQGDCVRSTEGTEFKFGFMENRWQSDGNQIPKLVITISSRFAGDYSLYFGDPEVLIQTGTLTANGTDSIVLTNPTTNTTFLRDYVVVGSDTIESKMFRLVSDNPVNLYTYSFIKNSSDAAVVYPTQSLGQEYFVMAYSPDVDTLNAGQPFQRGRNSEFIVVATEDNTVVEIEPTAFIENRVSPGPFIVVLQEGQIYQGQSENIANAVNQGDLTGTKISANKKVAVYSGNHGTRIPVGTDFWDFIVEQMPPTSSWGRKYITVPLSMKTRDLYRVLAAEDGTTVTISATNQIVPLDEGEFYEFALFLDQPSEISANKPILVTQFSTSHWDGFAPWSNTTGPGTFNGRIIEETYNGDDYERVGDPFMLTLSPVNQFKDDVTFEAIQSPLIKENIFVNIITETSNISNIRFDGAAIDGFFTAINGSDYSYAQVKTTQGQHRLLSTNAAKGFLAYQYGFSVKEDGSRVESYGYGVGFNITYNVELDYGSRVFSNDTVWDCDFKPNGDPDNDNVTLTAIGLMDKYEWFKDGVSVLGPLDASTPGSDTFISNGDGWYKVMGYINGDTTCFAQDSVYVQTMSVDIHATNVKVCPYESATFSIPNLSYDNVLWSNSETANSIVVDQTDNYEVEVTINGCLAKDDLDFLVIDDEAPNLTCLPSITVDLDDNGEVTVLPSQVLNTLSDACFINDSIDLFFQPNLTELLYTCSDLGSNGVTLIAVDPSGNSDECTSFINVEDNIVPTASNPADRVRMCIDSIPIGAGGEIYVIDENDNCPITVSYVSETDNGGKGCLGDEFILTKTYLIEDQAGNEHNVFLRWIAKDEVDPTITCPNGGTITQDSDAGENFATIIMGTPIVDDLCGGGVGYTNDFNDTDDGSDQYPIGTTTVMWTAVDSCGNDRTCNVIVTVNDGEGPDINCPVQTTNIFCVENLPDPYTTLAEFLADGGAASDNDGINAGSFQYNGQSSDGNKCPEIVTRTYQVADINGSISFCVQTLTVDDTEEPFAPTPPNINIECITDIPAADVTQVVGETDNCGVKEVSFISDFSDGNLCPEVITRTYRVIDSCGNTFDVQQLIVIDDDTDPTAGIPSNIEVACIEDIPDPDPSVVPNPTDNCGIRQVAWVNDLSDNLTCPETITRTYSVTDSCDNRIVVQQLIIVNDVTAPVASNPDTIFIECNTEIPAPDIDQVTDETDNCGLLKVAFVSDVSDGNVCPETITRTFEITDSCGNSTTVNQFIIIEDNTPPTASNLDSVYLECIEDLPGPDVLLVDDEADNCVESLVVSFVSDVSNDQFCDETITRTYSVIDTCGNTTFVTQIFTIADTTAPVIVCPDDIIQDTDADTNVATVTMEQIIVSNNCSGSVTILNDYNGTENGSDQYPIGLTSVEWTVTDTCNNISTCLTTVFVQDTSAPQLDCFATPELITCIDLLPAEIQTLDEFIAAGGGVSDNDGIDTTSFALDTAFSDGLTCPETITRIYTISDVNSVQSFCIQNWVINDTILPTAGALDTIFVDIEENVPAWDIQVVDDEADNCGIDRVEFVSDVSDGEKCPQTIIRTYRVLDLCGNTIDLEQIIIIDNDPDAYEIDEDLIEICEGDSAKLFINGSYSTIEWNTGETTDTIYVLETGWFKPLVDGCNISDSVEVIYTPLPLPTFHGDFNQMCFTGIAQIVASPSSIDYEYNWYEGENSVLIQTDANKAIFDVVPDSYATVGMSYSVRNCVSDTIWEDGVKSSFEFDYETSIDSGCAPLPVTFTGTNDFDGDIEYQWFINDISLSDRSGDSWTHVFEDDGDFKIEVVASSGITGCTQSIVDSGRIKVFHLPEALIELNTLVSPSVTFNNISRLADYFVWKYGDGTMDTLYSADEALHVYTDGGKYDVTLEAYTIKGCSDTAVYRDLIILPITPAIPNAIRNSSDLEENRMFLPIIRTGGIDRDTYLMTIYNRWGGEVFITRDLDKPWDGFLYNGNQAELGSYVYHIVYKDFNGTKYEYRGQVVVVK